jgi:hypothetical protein
MMTKKSRIAIQTESNNAFLASVMSADNDFSIAASYLDFISNYERAHRLGRTGSHAKRT